MRKKEHDLILISESLKAMAHPDRISILTLLGQKKEIKFSVNQICDKLKLNQPEASRHLSILKNKGVLLFERVGSHIYYSLNKNNLVFNCIEKLLDKK
ncbi:MAG: metalloregulator ArsR/SmtB family transcription factor [Bacteroidota bacterium]|jgi:DNA-binding transcriptional ArsR family regulator|nr:metalloregulator ArsR/SmtB family transcription factor [Bacteroidota bacterium]